METLRGIAASAERILLPKSNDASDCWEQFTKATGIEIPPFIGRRLITCDKDGRQFIKARGDDMPELVARGLANIAVTTTESRVESGIPQSSLASRRIGGPVCRYSILATEEMVGAVTDLCRRGSRYPITPFSIPATYPNLLNQIAATRDMPVYADPRMRISGSGEAMAVLFGTGLVADRVSSGRTAMENGLLEAVKLCDLYTELIWRPGNENV